MMTPEKKIRPLVFIIIFLFVTNVILLLFLVFNRNYAGTSPNPDGRSIVETFLQDSIGFDKQQMARYQNLRKTDFEKRKPIIENMKSARNNFYENIYTDVGADSLVNKAALILGETQIAVDRHMLQYFKNVRKICTTEQQPRFDSSFRSVVEKVTPGRFKKHPNR